MSGINDTSTVKQQYATTANLNKRISIHDKYSTNKQGFHSWIVSNYEIEPGMKVLELGCGTGVMWRDREALIDSCSRLVLSDFSEGMVAAARETVGSHEKVEYRVIDIQAIPFSDDTFDVVIANMMLYHVPDLDKGLSEVRRVLKDGGHFYCATYGEHGIMEYLSEILSGYGVQDNINKNFTLQNGYELLNRHFSAVEKLEYIDSLEVMDVEDMIDYIYSLASMTALNQVPRQEIRAVLEEHMAEGVLKVPKEYGMFVVK